MKIVELHPASVWDCEECGRENFCRMVKPELSAEELQELRDDLGINEWEAGDLLMQPTKVKCQFCFAEFDTEEQ